MSRIHGDFGRPARVEDPEKQAQLDARYIKRLEVALSRNGEDPRWSAVTALAAAGVWTVVVLAALVGLLILLNELGSGPESALSLVFVVAAVVLIMVVCTLSIVFKRLRLVDGQEAMGLPKGSVRAVIALMLILLFFIAAIFLFSSTQRDLNGDTRTLNALSAAQYAALDPAEILSALENDAGTTTTYDVILLPALSNTTSSDDIAKQLITTVGTLVTAVAAFYFGANSVSTAREGGGRNRRTQPDGSPERDGGGAQSDTGGKAKAGGTGGGAQAGGTGGGVGGSAQAGGAEGRAGSGAEAGGAESGAQADGAGGEAPADGATGTVEPGTQTLFARDAQDEIPPEIVEDDDDMSGR